MRVISFIKKSLYESLTPSIQLEFTSNAHLNKGVIPEHTLSGEVYYAFEFCEKILQTTHAKHFPCFSEVDANAVIASGVAPSSSGLDFSSTNQALSSKVLPNGKKLFKRNHGSDYVIVAPGATETLAWDIAYPWVKLEAVEILYATKKLTADFSVFDTDTGAYSGVPNYQLNTFGFDVNVAENYHRFASRYDADLFYGMSIELSLTNSSTLEQEVCMNIELNEVV